MSQTFYFFDLETSGFNPRTSRIMQFAGQRTGLDLKPIGEPDNLLIKLTNDILPEPGAVLVHGITPQKANAEGVSEAEFTKYLTNQVFTPDTIAVGYNNIRFDNEFIRFALWRNFYDPYEWAWKDGRSTWDLLDAGRMMRALRPDGIKWPFAPDGKPSNKLELIASVNKFKHDAHDALSDVQAVMELAKLFKAKQPKLFDYLLNLRAKAKVATLVGAGQPLVYTSGRYPSEFNKTTVAVRVATKADKSGALMYDLRIDPTEFTDLSAAELSERWSARGSEAPYFPVKNLGYNRCPALAPLDVLELEDGYKKIGMHKPMIQSHLRKLQQQPDFGGKLLEALDLMWPKRQTQLAADPLHVDEQLYDGFVPDVDRAKAGVVRMAEPAEIASLNVDFSDDRLKALLPLYKARNFYKYLSPAEQEQWEAFRTQKLLGGGKESPAANFFKRLEELANTPGLSGEDKYLLEELDLYGQSIVPAA